MPTFRSLSEEALFFRRTQITKYTHVYSITLQMAMPAVSGRATTIDPVLQIMEDADFHITRMVGSVTEPVDINGKRENFYNGQATVYPLPGSPLKGERGVFFKFIDPEVNTRLMIAQPSENAVVKAAQLLSPYNQTYLSFADVFSPGYGASWGKPVKFDYTLMKSKRLKIRLESRQWIYDEDDGSTQYSRISMAFIGHRYTTNKVQS